MVHAQTGGVGEFAAFNAVREPRFVHGGLKRRQRLRRQGDAHVHRPVFVSGPFNGITAFVVLVLLDGQNGFVFKRPLLFIVIRKGCDGVHAVSGDGVVHPRLFVEGVLHVVLVVVFELQRGKGERTDDDEAPADQGELEGPFCAPLLG